MLDQIDQPNSRKIANMVHRGAAKTTVLGEYLILYLATFGEMPNFGTVDFALYVSDSIDNGVKNMRKNLEYRWDNSEFLKKYVPFARFTDIHWHFKNKAGKEFIVKGYGAKTGVRGTKANGKRPQIAILDDLVSDEDARSKTMIAAIEDTVHKAIDHAMHQHVVRSSGLVLPLMQVILYIKQLNQVHGQSTVIRYAKGFHVHVKSLKVHGKTALLMTM